MIELTSLDYVWYVPLFDGNRARAESGADPDPFRVELKTPSYGFIREAGARAGDAAARAAFDRAYFVAHVRGITGLRLDGQPVTTGEQLWTLGAEQNRLAADLFLELFQALDSRATLRAGVIGPLPSPSRSHA
jgi:hypothetical protein